jgi:hypothetical protein
MSNAQKTFIAAKAREYRKSSGLIVRTADDLTYLDYEKYAALGENK